MSYVNSNLLVDEQVVVSGKVHWWVYARGIMWLLCTAVAFGLALSTSTDIVKKILIVIGVLLFCYGIFCVLQGLMETKFTELAITNKRVIAKVGVLRRQTFELLHTQIESVNIEQSVLGRVLNFGTVMVVGTGGTKEPIANITAPLVFRRLALNAIDQYHRQPR